MVIEPEAALHEAIGEAFDAAVRGDPPPSDGKLDAAILAMIDQEMESYMTDEEIAQFRADIAAESKSEP